MKTTIRPVLSVLMETYVLQIHHTIGRLRVRGLNLEQNPARALDTKTCLGQMNGVRSVHLSSLTGSLLVHFDPKACTPETLVQTILCSQGTNTVLRSSPRAVEARPLHSRAARRAAEAAFAYAGHKLFESMVSALLGALL